MQTLSQLLSNYALSFTEQVMKPRHTWYEKIKSCFTKLIYTRIRL